MPRAAKELVDIRSIARGHTEQMIKVLVGVANSKGAQAGARVAAAAAILDRGWGKAPQQLVGEEGGDIKIVIRQIIENAVVSPEPEQIEDGTDDKPATPE